MSGPRTASSALAAAFTLGLALAAAADVYVLRDGDRITGKPIAEGKRIFRIQTRYGRLTIPRDRIEKVVREDGREDMVNPNQTAPIPAPLPSPQPRLVLAITGRTFWYAWDPPKGTTVDPSIRLEVRLDEKPIAAYTDAKPDPEEMRGATVNRFSFLAGDLAVSAAAEVGAQPPEVRPGRIVLPIDLPARWSGQHRLRFAYQINAATEADPSWRDVASASVDLEVRHDAVTFVDLHQDLGRMEFSGLLGRKRMRNVETFRIEAKAEQTPVSRPP